MRMSAKRRPLPVRVAAWTVAGPSCGLTAGLWCVFAVCTGASQADTPTPAPAPPPTVARVLPEVDGAWLEMAKGSGFGPATHSPLPLPSVTHDAALLDSSAGAVQAVAMWIPDPGLPSDADPEIIPLPPVLPAPYEDQTSEPVVTMPPAYPNNWAPFAIPTHPVVSRSLRKVARDYRNFYSCESLVCLTAAFGAGALMANTGFDTTMQTAWQNGVTPTGMGTFFHECKPLGEGSYALPIFGVAAATGLIFDGRPAGSVVGEWGSRSLRMFIVGGPPVYVLQLATGASRPSEDNGSQWHFWNDNNGVSGHAFVGAIPFLAAAEMVESPLLKGTLYICSTFTAFSRMTDNAHYPSQVFLGWYLAWASSMAVSRTEVAFDTVTVRVVPLPMADLGGLAMEARW